MKRVLEKVFFLLAKMELSSGFLNVTKNAPKSYSSQHSLIPPPKILSKLIINNPLAVKEEHKYCTSFIVTLIATQEEEEKPGNDPVKSQRTSEQERIAIEMCTDKLQRLFMWYCSISDNSNTNKMPMSKFMSFLKDAGLLSGSVDVAGKNVNPCIGTQITPTDVELIFAKVVGLLNDKRLELGKESRTSPLKNEKVMKLYSETESKRAKLDFKAFYYAITIIAKRVYPDKSTNQALITLTEKVSALSPLLYIEYQSTRGKKCKSGKEFRVIEGDVRDFKSGKCGGASDVGSQDRSLVF